MGSNDQWCLLSATQETNTTLTSVQYLLHTQRREKAMLVLRSCRLKANLKSTKYWKKRADDTEVWSFWALIMEKWASERLNLNVLSQQTAVHCMVQLDQTPLLPFPLKSESPKHEGSSSLSLEETGNYISMHVQISQCTLCDFPTGKRDVCRLMTTERCLIHTSVSYTLHTTPTSGEQERWYVDRTNQWLVSSFLVQKFSLTFIYLLF